MIVRVVLLLAFIFSVGVCFYQPKMHSKVLVYSSDYSIVEPNTVEEKVEQTPVKTQVEQDVKVQPKTEVQTQKTVKKETAPQKTVKTVQKTPEPVKTKTVQTAKKEVAPVKKEEVKKTQPITQTKTETTKTLTKQEQEELIAWNKWHSDIQNSIMRDTKLPPVPNGTRFDFTFTVDKYGRVSDIKTWSQNPEFTPYAIQFIAPVIRSYQGKSILNFPANSRRITTQFVGKFKISTSGQNKYSSASDYNDVEKIRK